MVSRKKGISMFFVICLILGNYYFELNVKLIIGFNLKFFILKIRLYSVVSYFFMLLIMSLR